MDIYKGSPNQQQIELREQTGYLFNEEDAAYLTARRNQGLLLSAPGNRVLIPQYQDYLDNGVQIADSSAHQNTGISDSAIPSWLASFGSNVLSTESSLKLAWNPEVGQAGYDQGNGVWVFPAGEQINETTKIYKPISSVVSDGLGMQFGQSYRTVDGGSPAGGGQPSYGDGELTSTYRAEPGMGVTWAVKEGDQFRNVYGVFSNVPDADGKLLLREATETERISIEAGLQLEANEMGRQLKIAGIWYYVGLAVDGIALTPIRTPRILRSLPESELNASNPISQGKIQILDGAMPDANELRAAQGLADLGHNVTSLPTASSQGIQNIRTADLAVSDIGMIDVYTPKTNNPNAMVRAIEAKNTQARGVLLQVDLSIDGIESVAARIWGKPTAQNIEVLFFQNSNGTIIRVNRPIGY